MYDNNGIDINVYHNVNDLIIHDCDSLSNITTSEGINIELSNKKIYGNGSLRLNNTIDTTLYFAINNLNYKYLDINNNHIGFFIYIDSFIPEFFINIRDSVDTNKQITWQLSAVKKNINYKSGWNYISLNFMPYSQTNIFGCLSNDLNSNSIIKTIGISFVDAYRNQPDVNYFLIDDIRIAKNNPKTVGILQSFSNVGTFIWSTVKSVFNVINVNPILIFGFALIAIGASVGLVSRLRNG